VLFRSPAVSIPCGFTPNGLPVGLQIAGPMWAEGRCQRALVLALETFGECEALWRRARWVMPGPFVESAACALIGPADTVPAYRAATTAAAMESAVDVRAGRTMACAPLLALALAREAGQRQACVTGTWRGRTAAIEMAIAARSSRT